MSKSSDSTIAQRMGGIGGSWAEEAFMKYGKARGYSIERYGFDHAKLKNFRLLPSFVRHTPDYACTHDGKSFLVECKGAGRGTVVNIKLEDMDALKLWDEQTRGRVFLFINDSDRKKVSLIHFNIIYQRVPILDTDVWHDGVEFYKVPKSMFVWEDRA